MVKVTPVGFEPTPFRNGALSHRLRPLGQSVIGSHNVEVGPARNGTCIRKPCDAAGSKRPHQESNLGCGGHDATS